MSKFENKKPVIVHLPSKLNPGTQLEHKIPSENDLYKNRDFVDARINNLIEQLDEMETSMVLAAERHEYFIASATSPDDDQFKATMEMIVEIDKEYEMAKKELAELRELRRKLS